MSSNNNYQRQCPICQHEILFSLNYKPQVFKFYVDDTGTNKFEREDNNDLVYPKNPYLELICSYDITHDIEGVFTEDEKDNIKSNLIQLVKMERLLKIDDDFKKKKQLETNSKITFEETLEYFQKTTSHIREVGEGIQRLITELQKRILNHDKSKIENKNEVEGFIILNKEKQKNNFKFGTEEYKNALDKIKKVVTGHYIENRHHPEYWDNKIHDMDLVDIIEMFCDWASACKRDKNGDIMNSIQICCNKFGIDTQLKLILEKTAITYFKDKLCI